MSKKNVNLGVAFYYVIVERRKAGLGNPLTQTLGPFSSPKKAEEVKIEQEEAAGETGWEYNYRISVEPNPFSK